ncbi:MAG: BMP family ABC transporter substrate-binding protein [Actinomycetia bacterium]|nr:BMP family ABC transporter substrate-binding protein [Actinomycetes bacterium]
MPERLRISRLVVLIALACAIAITAGACGGDGETAAPPAPAPAPEPPPPPPPAPAGEGPPQAKPSPRIVQLHPDAVTAGGWYRDGTAAFEKMAAILGSEAVVLERITYDEGPATLRRLGQEGWDIIVSHSSGYESAVLEVAPEFPDTWFLIYSDLSTTNDLPNVAGWAVNWNEVGYMAAAIACAASSTGEIGMVNSAPIPAMTRWGGGSTQLAEDSEAVVGKPCNFNVVWTGNFFDAAAAKQAALSMINNDADVLFDAADAAGAGAVEAAVQEGTKYIGGVVDQCDQAPETIVTSVIMNFDIAYAQMGNLYKDGELEPIVYPENVANEGILVTRPFCNPDPDVEATLDDIIAKIGAGEIVVDATREIEP